MSNNPAKVLIKQYLRSILDISEGHQAMASKKQD